MIEVFEQLVDSGRLFSHQGGKGLLGEAGETCAASVDGMRAIVADFETSGDVASHCNPSCLTWQRFLLQLLVLLSHYPKAEVRFDGWNTQVSIDCRVYLNTKTLSLKTELIMPIDRMSSSRDGGYGHSFAVKHQRTPDSMPQGSSAASSGSWKTIETLKSLPTDFPATNFDRSSVDRPIGLLQRKIELQDKGLPTKNIDNAYKESMNQLYQATSKSQSTSSNETDRNRLSNWSDKLLETNKNTPFLAKK
ncbi:hypothetical protein OR626_08055 [Pseudomonas sp. S1Bt30]|uniref:Uncharacterized protein n=1 Tax=Pseudomonas quebecensis TaxID=2995174 RepID=A0ABY6QM46_9PSED|nr:MULTISPECIES: hypothetical protein [Pseudomonas]MCX4064171.1 hypothetical protein [Pseudomonas quebecensis]UZW19961.1 hypothetical protein OSC50_06330 [Pseudomonas quebecensis]UZW22621.1 hypothetical protein OSC48_19150 [Pseudomonas quebecensis]UZW27683.1 hypothetical protein OSC49_19155 [Pseudomonas quebecensis]